MGAGAEATQNTALDNARAFVEVLVGEDSTTFDNTALRGLTVELVEPGRVVCRFAAKPHTLNRYDTLHGGCIATLLDSVSTAVMITLGQPPGMSLQLSVNYMTAVPSGKDVLIDATVVKAGRTVAVLQADIVSVDGKTLFARGTHTKFLPVKKVDLQAHKFTSSKL